MINVDIYVAMTEEMVEFWCDETVPVYYICQDVYHAMTQDKEKKTGEIQPEEEKFWLCDLDNQRILSEEKSLKEQGVVYGSRLFLV